MTSTLQNEVSEMLYWGSRVMVGGRNSFMRGVALDEVRDSLARIRWCYGESV